MNTTEELFDKTGERAPAVFTESGDVRADEENSFDIPEDFYNDIEDEPDTDASDENMDIFEMNFSDIEAEEAREAEKEEKKAKRKKEKGQICWFNLTVRILAIVLGPILVLTLFYNIATGAVSQRITKQLLKGEMENITLSAVETFTVFARGDYSYTDGVFYKGTTNMEPMYEYLDDMSQKANVDIMVFFGDTCVMTTYKDENGVPYAGIKVDTKIYENILVKHVLKGNYYYDSKTTNLSGAPYATYYYPLMQESSGEIVGAVFCGMDRSGIDRNTNGIVTSLVLFGIIFAIVAAALCTFEVRHITRVIRHSVRNLTRVAEGELTVQVVEADLKRTDEIGEITRSVKQLADELNKIVGNIRNSSGQVSDFTELMTESMDRISETVGSVNLAVEEIAKGATSQATETMQANTQVAQIGSAIEVTVAEVENLSTSAKKMDEFSIEADKTLQELLIISKDADDAINEIKKQTEETNDSAQQIQKATDMISAIASQTNLLSLNASIEAARAGEAGKGFAVVADEIRQLADQSRTSAEEIREIVDVLLRNSDASVKKMNHVSASILTQNDKLDETLKVFTSLSAEVSGVMRAIKEITSQTKALAELREGVVNIVEGLAAIAEENAAGAQETSASMYEVSAILEECTRQTEELAVLKDELEKNVALFTMRDETVTGVPLDAVSAENPVTEEAEEMPSVTGQEDK